MASQSPAAAARVRAQSRSRLQAVQDTSVVRFFVRHPDLAAALLFALFVLVYLWPVLLGGKLLSPNVWLYGFAPWQRLTPPGADDYFSWLLSDVPRVDYPWRWFVRESLRDGTLPVWNPYVFGGAPFLSNPQIGLYTPFNLPLWVLPFNYALGLVAALKLWAGGFGTYLLVRQLRLGFLPGLLAGVCFSFCSMNIVWLTHDTLPAVAVLLPWTLWLVERIFARGRLGSTLWLGVVTAIGLGGGHPGMQVHLMAIAGLYALVRVWLVPDLERGERVRRLGLALAGLVLGALLMAVMLLPEALSSRGTLGTQSRAGSRGSIPGSVMPFDAIRTVLFPDWWGRPSGAEVPPTGPTSGAVVNYNERTFYGGVVAVLLGLVAVVSKGGWRSKAPFLLLAVVGLAAPLHLPGLWDFLTNVPPFDVIQNQRLHFVFEFGVAMLAAFGLQAVLDRPDEERWRLAVPLGAVILGLVMISAIGVRASDVSDVVEHFASGRSFEVAEVLALTSVTWFLLLSIGLGIALLAVIRWPYHAAAIATVVVLLAVVDMLHFADRYQPMAPAAAVNPPRTPAIDYLQEHVGRDRIMALAESLPSDWAMTYGIADVRGYDPPSPTLRFFDLWRAANPLQENWTPFMMDGLNVEGAKVISALGARYLITPPALMTDPEEPALAALEPAYEGEDATIFVNEDAMPRVAIARRILVSGSEEETRAKLVREDFSPRRATVVERDERAAVELAGEPVARGRVSIAEEENSRVTLDATLDRRGLVILNDSLTDGWTVEVDGERAEPVRVNSLMRGVVVGPGEHEIVWSYKLPGLRTGALVTLAALVALVGAAATLTVRRRRTSPGAKAGPE